MAVAGVQRATGRAGAGKILHDTLVITEYHDLRSPNRCQFTAKGFTPADGDRVVITLGGADNPERLFLGTVVTDERSYIGTLDNGETPVSCVDNTRLLNQSLVTKRYTASAADAIVLNLMSTYASSFGVTGVQTGLDTIDEITFTNQELAACLLQVAKRIGASVYLAPEGTYGNLHFFVGDEGLASAFVPSDLTTAHDSLSDVSLTTDGSEVVTRVRVEGGGANAAGEVAVGETILPVTDASWYDDAGGTVVAGPQRVTYTGVDEGGGGTIVGTGAAPSSALTAAIAAGAGVDSGAHSYAYTFVTGAGESVASPLAPITVGTVSAPSSAPSAGTPTTGGSVDAGAHYYAVTFETSSGETTASSVSNTVTTSAGVSTPTDTPAAYFNYSTSYMSAGDYRWAYTHRRTSDGAETALSPVSGALAIPGAPTAVCGSILNVALPPSGYEIRLYRTVANGSTYYYATEAYRAADSGGFAVFSDNGADANLGAQAPSSNSTTTRTVALTGIPTSSSPAVTSRKLYRTAAGGAQLKLLATIANNTDTTYNDTTADSSLGANVPGSNTATANQVSLTAIAVGPSGTTSRKVYRTAAAGSQLKLLTTLANNTTTTYTDSTADASLGANVPTSDTSGLAQPTGQVLAGTTSIPVAGTGGFPSAGWAVIGNGQQVVRYTGLTAGTTLTGVPASGVGSITASIAYNSTVTACPQLTGVPASSTGSVLYTIPKGEAVNLLVTVNDTTAQTALAARLGASFGVQEYFIQDRRLSSAEATARGQAYLDLRKNQERILRWRSRDKNTRAGRVVTATLAAFNLSDTFKIQQVTITNFVPSIFPTFTATASNSRYSLEELLRAIKAA